MQTELSAIVQWEYGAPKNVSRPGKTGIALLTSPD